MVKTLKSLSGPTPIPFVGNIHQFKTDKMHQTLEKWVKEYGEVYKIKIGPKPVTVITNSALIQKMLKNRPEGFRRTSKMDKIMSEVGVDGVFNAEGETWKAHRKMVAKGLDINHQKQFFPAMLKSITRLSKKWESVSELNTPYDIQKDLMRFTVDVTTELAFGYEMNTIEQESDVIQQHLEKVFPTIFKRINSPIPYWRWFKTRSDKEFEKSLKAVHKVVDEFIEKSKQKLKQHPELKNSPSNFLEALIVASEKEQSITDHEVKSNVFTMLLAGEDTTSHTMAWIIVYLCNHKNVLEKLQKEIDDKWTMDMEKLDYENLPELRYLEAVAYEAMRLKPVAPILLLEPLKDIELDGYLFEKGSSILLENRVGALNPDYFNQPEFFNPDRWIEYDTRKKHEGHNTDAFIPFGSGPRYCPGSNLAMLEIKLVIASLISNFEIGWKETPQKVEEIMAFTMMPSKFTIQLKKRAKK